jgi:hypothetical protein
MQPYGGPLLRPAIGDMNKITVLVQFLLECVNDPRRLIFGRLEPGLLQKIERIGAPVIVRKFPIEHCRCRLRFVTDAERQIRLRQPEQRFIDDQRRREMRHRALKAVDCANVVAVAI